MNISITGLGAYDPPTVIENDDLKKFVETSDEWISSRTGIRRRHVSTGETVLDMAEKAAMQAVETSGVPLAGIQLVVFATSTPDCYFPMTAALLRNRLGMADGPAIDVSAGCTGLVYALSVAASMMEGMGFEHALVVGSEMLSRVLDWSDRSTCVLLGDGAGAYVLSRGGGGIKSLYLNSRGDASGFLAMNALPARNPWIAESETPFDGKFHMNGQEVFRFAMEAVPDAVNEAVRRAGMQLSDIDWIVPHQANLRIINSAISRLGIPPEKFFVNIADHGNTGSASIPIALSEMRDKGLLKSGQNIVIVAFGAGFSWGSAMIEWQIPPVTFTS
jgi:3-oxoacyl-[acyl-carrier-protein] synthase III